MAANPSKKLPALPPAIGKNGAALVSEKIDERILRLLRLEEVFDIDYDTYISLLRERVAASGMSNNKIPTEEVELLTDEFKRVKGKKGKGRFKVKKISAEAFKKGSATGLNLKAKKSLVGIDKLLLPPAKEEAVTSQKSELREIIDNLGEIIKLLTLQNKSTKKASEDKRKEAETARRGLAESALESGFKAAIKVAEKVLTPVKSLLKRIIDFFVAIFLGRTVYLLLEWFSKKENQDKIKAIGRFLSDHWPKLLALYIRFGTGLGKFVGGLTKVVFFGVRKLLQVVAQVVGAKGAARFLGGRGGKLVAAGLQVATTVGTTMALSSGIENFAGIGEGEQEKTKIPTFFGGGLADIKRLLGFSGGGFGKPGYVSGEKGVDKIPAMLSDGEFVMSRGAVQKYGVDTLEAMNAAGGGTNKPKIVKSTTYAAGGGYIGEKEDKKEKIRDPILEKRDKEIKKTFGPGATPTVSTQEDFDKFRAAAEAKQFGDRLKRIEAQMQVQKALASGKAIDIRGSSYGANIGKGFATQYQGRDAIVIKNGIDYNTYSTGISDKEITLGGKSYYAVKRGKDLIYVSNFASGMKGQVNKYGARNESYKGKGGGVVSNLTDKEKKSLPKTKIMMGPDGPFVGYLRYRNGEPEYARPTQRKKGTLESIADFFNPTGARIREENLNARTMRLTAMSDLEDMRRRGLKEENIKKMMNERLGVNGYSRAVNDLKAKQQQIRIQEKIYAQDRGVGGMGGLGSDYKQQELKLASAANKPKLKEPSPPPKPRVVYKASGGGMGGRRGSGSKPSSGGKPKTPQFGAVCPSSNRPRTRRILGIF